MAIIVLNVPVAEKGKRHDAARRRARSTGDPPALTRVASENAQSVAAHRIQHARRHEQTRIHRARQRDDDDDVGRAVLAAPPKSAFATVAAASGEPASATSARRE